MLSGGEIFIYATLQSGNIACWFEQLCRIGHNQLKELVSSKHMSLRPKFILSKGEVYTLCWSGDSSDVENFQFLS